MTDTSTPNTGSVLGLLSVAGQTVGIDLHYLAEVAPVDGIQKTLVAQHQVLGLVSIRGGLIPICDPLGAFGSETRPATVAILSDGDVVAGLAVDGVMGLHRYKTDALQKIEGLDPRSYSKGTLQTKKALIHVLDAGALLKDTAFPHAKRETLRRQDRLKSTTAAYLSFDAGGIRFAARVEAVWGTVPRRSIEDATHRNGAFLGSITHFKRRIPVMDTNAVFGLGVSAMSDPSSSAETVVLRFPDDQLLGFAVDKICQVAHPKTKDILPLTPEMRSMTSYVEATAKIGDAKHFLISETELQDIDDLRAVAELSIREEDTGLEERFGAVEGELIRERERYLLLRAGSDLAVHMTDVVSMRQPPNAEEISPWDSHIPGAEGLIFVNDKLMPLIRLATHLGRPSQPDPARARLLIAQAENFEAGFMVDTVDGIALSMWRSAPTSEDDASYTIGLRFQKTQGVRSCVNLKSLTQNIANSRL